MSLIFKDIFIGKTSENNFYSLLKDKPHNKTMPDTFDMTLATKATDRPFADFIICAVNRGKLNTQNF